MNDDYEFDFSKPPTLKFYNAFIDSTDLSEYVNKAKQMEKEQIIYSNESGFEDGVSFEKWGNPIFDSAEQYYNETYGK